MMKLLFCPLLTFALLSCDNGDNSDKPLDPVVAGVSDSGMTDEGNYKNATFFRLPAGLEEISGITWFADSVIAAIEDESGKVYFIDPSNGKITGSLQFGDNGDYEGIAYAGRDLYVMRSDGVLFQISDPGKKNQKVTQHRLSVDYLDLEGLAYDPSSGKLLLAAKSAGKDFKDGNPVFSFSPSTGQFDDKPLFLLQEEHDESDKGKKKKNSKVSPSEIAIGPDGGYVFIDSKSETWFKTGRDGKITESIKLGQKQFPQPEGMVYDTQGRLWIASEGKGGPGILVMFSSGQPD